MEFHPNWTLFFNWTELANGDVNDQQYLAECLHAVFTVLAVIIGITGVISNVGLILSLIIVARTRRELSPQTKHLVISLATADIFLLIFGFYFTPFLLSFSIDVKLMYLIEKYFQVYLTISWQLMIIHGWKDELVANSQLTCQKRINYFALFASSSS